MDGGRGGGVPKERGYNGVWSVCPHRHGNPSNPLLLTSGSPGETGYRDRETGYMDRETGYMDQSDAIEASA